MSLTGTFGDFGKAQPGSERTLRGGTVPRCWEWTRLSRGKRGTSEVWGFLISAIKPVPFSTFTLKIS